MRACTFGIEIDGGSQGQVGDASTAGLPAGDRLPGRINATVMKPHQDRMRALVV